MKRLPIADYLRVFLAAEVVVAHAFKVPVPIIAVPAFLALSGLLVPASLESSRGTGHFWWKRILRIYPALFAMLGFVWLAGGSAWNICLTYLTLGAHDGPPNNAVWSLGWEELFYGFMCVIAALGAYRKRWPIWCLFGLSCIAAPLALATLDLAPRHQSALPLGMAFFTGNLAYLYGGRIGKVPLWAIGLLLGASAWFAMQRQPLHATLLAAPGVLALALRPSKLPRIPDVSYGLYIWHLPVMWLASRYGLAPWVGAILTIPVALLSWYLIEAPALRLKDRLPRLRGWVRPRSPLPACSPLEA